MESLLDPVELNRETTQALDEIRSGVDNALYGAASVDAEEKIYRFVLPLIEDAGLPSTHIIHYRWYLRELARHWRTRKGRDLAFHLELCVRKWVHLGLEPRTLQFLICESHQRLKGCQPLTANSLPLTASTLTPDPQPPTPDIETAKDAKTANSEHSIPRSLDPSISSSSHSIPRSLGPSIPSDSAESVKSADVRSLETAKHAKIAKTETDSTTKTPSHQESEHSIPRSLRDSHEARHPPSLRR
jgi:hypothetical protein